MRKKNLGIIFTVIFFGVIIGSLLGKLVALLLPDGVVKDFFLKSITAGFDPVTLNLGIIKMTLGFTFIVNIIGLIGLGIAAYLLKWYYGPRV
ncbi:hypothetical protein B6D60_06395 [candidate division KSB1 bacterium 4484_87]|nr:MAG: hypothetical protein B6D60_06395 [candidate division KSB1 bacterium 4484_87]